MTNRMIEQYQLTTLGEQPTRSVFLMRKAFEEVQDCERGKDSKVGVMLLKGGNAQLTDDSTRTQS